MTLCVSLFSFWFFMILFYNVHYILLLLVLEALLLSIFLFLCFYFVGQLGFTGLFVFLVIMVCLGGFSVSLLVSLSRFCGRDFWLHRFIF